MLSLGNFMVVLDTTITNVALSTIAGNLGVTTSEGIWIITAYAVANCGVVTNTRNLVGKWRQILRGAPRILLWTEEEIALTACRRNLAPSSKRRSTAVNCRVCDAAGIVGTGGRQARVSSRR